MKLRQIKFFILSLLLFINTLTLSGCWNSRELNTLGIVGIIGFDIDKNQSKIKISAEIFDPLSNSGSSDSKPVAANYIQSTGDTIFDTIRNITVKYDRKLFFPHIKFYIFSEEAARHGLIDYIDWYQRDHEPRLTPIILVAKNTTAEEIMGIHSGVGSTPTDYLEKLISIRGANSKVEGVNVLQFINAHYSKGVNPVVGVISKESLPFINRNINDPSSSILNAEGAAVFNTGALVGFLDGHETRGLNFVTNKVKSGIISISDTEKNSFSSLEIIKSKSKNSVDLSNNEVTLNVNTKIIGMLGEETNNVDLKDIDATKSLEIKFSEVVKKEIETSIKKVQLEYKSDVFGFGNIMHKTYPKQWKTMSKDWHNIFASAKVNVNVTVSINRTGLVNTPANRTEGD